MGEPSARCHVTRGKERRQSNPQNHDRLSSHKPPHQPHPRTVANNQSTRIPSPKNHELETHSTGPLKISPRPLDKPRSFREVPHPAANVAVTLRRDEGSSRRSVMTTLVVPRSPDRGTGLDRRSPCAAWRSRRPSVETVERSIDRSTTREAEPQEQRAPRRSLGTRTISQTPKRIRPRKVTVWNEWRFGVFDTLHAIAANPKHGHFRDQAIEHLRHYIQDQSRKSAI